ncbi:MAG: hypothetical protein ACFFBD_30330 [Candidatus Hodarchaeota archaeon]
MIEAGNMTILHFLTTLPLFFSRIKEGIILGSRLFRAVSFAKGHSFQIKRSTK